MCCSPLISFSSLCFPPLLAADSNKELTAQGHLYYLLDPKEERRPFPVQSTSLKSTSMNTPSYLSTSPPPLPNHHPRSNSCSPTNHLGSNGSSREALASSGRHSPRTVSPRTISARPKAHTITSSANKDKVGIGLKAKTTSLGRPSNIRH